MLCGHNVAAAVRSCYCGCRRPVGERVLTRVRSSVPLSPVTAGIRRALAVAAAIVALGLTGCGREGMPELPPGPAPAAPAATSQLTSPDGSPQDTAAKTGFDAQGNPVAAPGQKRPFILDPLLQ